MIKIGDTVRVLPNKMIGKVTDISEGFVILDGNQARPYMPQQLELVLKRYVLTDSNNIIEVSMPNILNDDDFDYFNKHTKKTSYNILDLVWDNDLLDLDGEIVHVFGIDEETGGYVLMNTDMIIKNSSNITAIYKRQANGDYKRYEVKE